MTASLPHNQVEQLVPVLGHLAAMVRDHETVDRSELEILLLGTGVESDRAIDELLLWARILGSARGVQDATRREAVQRALMLRGILEAPAMLALDTVAVPTGVQELEVSPDRIDFGTLPSGGGATAEFTISGGPGRLTTESDALHLEPDVFGAAPTTVRVRLEGLPVGLLLTTITLTTSRERLELPVTARWTALPSSEALHGAGGASSRPAPPASATNAGALPANQLGGVLLQLARLVAAKTYVSYDLVEQVLTTAGLSPTTDAVDAGKSWADVLQQAHDASRPGETAQAIAQLVSHGFSQGLAAQAVVTAVGSAKLSTPAAGTAKTAPPPQHIPLTRLVVALDGSGTHSDLAAALRDAAPRAVIQIRAGVHILATGVEILQPVTIEGESSTTTRVVLAKGRYALRYRHRGTFTLRRLTLERSSTRTAADMVVVQNGHVAIENCAFRGGRSSSKAVAGVGLLITGAVIGSVTSCTSTDNVQGFLLAGNTSAIVTDCTFVSNQMHGIQIMEQAHPTLDNNSCRLNHGSGIVFEGRSAGEARNNTCEENQQNGIYLGEQSSPVLNDNICRLNHRSGIAFEGTSAGEAGNNTCEENQQNGMYLGEQSSPVLNDNICRLNQWQGIVFFGTSAGEARNNTCEKNQQNGIGLTEQAKPLLHGNTCRLNQWQGIVFVGTSAGEARNNTCEKNQQHGITLAEQAKPLLHGNTCRLNHRSGIAFEGTSAGEAGNNTCEKNLYHGISIGEQSKPVVRSNACTTNQHDGIYVYGNAEPHLKANTCERNRGSGIAFALVAGGTVQDNICVGNRLNGINVAATALPTLKYNRCQNNGQGDIVDARPEVVRQAEPAPASVLRDLTVARATPAIDASGPKSSQRAKTEFSRTLPPAVKQQKVAVTPTAGPPHGWLATLRAPAYTGSITHASVWARGISLVVDVILGLVVAFLGAFLEIGVVRGNEYLPDLWPWLLIAAVGPFFFYFFLAYLVKQHSLGQPGSAITIVSSHLGSPTLLQWGVRSLVKTAEGCAFIVSVRQSLLAASMVVVLMIVPVLLPKHRALHDIAAGTQVVKPKK